MKNNAICFDKKNAFKCITYKEYIKAFGLSNLTIYTNYFNDEKP